MCRRIELASDGQSGLANRFPRQACHAPTKAPDTVDGSPEFVVSAIPISAGTPADAETQCPGQHRCFANRRTDGELIPAIRAHAEQFSGRPTATFVARTRVGGSGRLLNAVLVRYPDLLDTYSDSRWSVPSVGQLRRGVRRCEHVDASGSDFLLALAIAYEAMSFRAQVP